MDFAAGRKFGIGGVVVDAGAKLACNSGCSGASVLRANEIRELLLAGKNFVKVSEVANEVDREEGGLGVGEDDTREVGKDDDDDNDGEVAPAVVSPAVLDFGKY